MPTCNNCDETTNGKFCSNCGASIELQRIDMHYLYHEILHLVHFEKGFLYTVKELTIRPGAAVNNYLQKSRARFMKPVTYLILTSLLFTIVSYLFNANEILNNYFTTQQAESSIAAIQSWIQTHYGYTNIVMGFFIAICIKFIFRKFQYNIFEITILICFIMGQFMLFSALQILFINVLSPSILFTLLTIVGFIYPTWAIGQFFDKSKISSYVKAFIAYLMGYILFLVAIFAVVLLYEYVKLMK